MRYSLALLASAVSATVLPRGGFSGKAPVAAKGTFPTFTTLTLEQAIAGLDRELMGLPGGAANISTHRSHNKSPRAIQPDGEHQLEKMDLMTRDAASVSYPWTHSSHISSWFRG
jgi:hypothetical protein